MGVSTGNSYYPSLTGIRAVAAWMVFVHHFIPISRSSNFFLYNLAFEFHVGVSVFFVLSGFLIFHRYQAAKKEGDWISRYLRNRFARIFPLFFVLTVATYVLGDPEIHAGLETLPAFLLSISLLNGYSDTFKFIGISQAWTLTVEETFYVLAPIIMTIRSKAQLFFVPVIALMIGLLCVFLSRNSQNFFGDKHFMLTYTFFGRCTEFCTGIFLGMILVKNNGLRSGRYTYIGSILIVAAIVVMALLRGNDETTFLTYNEIAITNFIFPLCVATFFYGLVTETTWIAAILSSKFLQILGKSSYAFYLIHIGIIQQFFSRAVTGNTIFLFILLNMTAMVLYYGLERPLQDLVRAKGVDRKH